MSYLLPLWTSAYSAPQACRAKTKSVARLCSTSLCEACCVGTLCLPGGLNEGDLPSVASLSIATREVVAGTSIYMAGDGFHNVYAIRAGTCKTSIVRAGGHEQVTGFHLAGDFMGMEGMAEDVHHTTATALEDTQVCIVPYRRLVAITAEYPRASDFIARLMGVDMQRHSSQLVLLGLAGAPARVAGFLLDLSERYAVRGWAPRDLKMPMSRADIASSLGLQFETVCRALTTLERDGHIVRKTRAIHLVDPARLRAAYRVRTRL